MFKALGHHDLNTVRHACDRILDGLDVGFQNAGYDQARMAGGGIQRARAANAE